jgi:hypothetical protein
MARRASDFVADGGRYLMNKYALSRGQTEALLRRTDRAQILHEHEQWRENNGFPAANSPLSRGRLARKIAG